MISMLIGLSFKWRRRLNGSMWEERLRSHKRIYQKLIISSPILSSQK